MMEDFDIFTNEINLSKSSFKNILNKMIYDAPSTPHSINYQIARKLLAEECLADNDEDQCTFHFSEAVSASIRTSVIYREEQRDLTDNKLKLIQSYYNIPEQDTVDANPILEQDKKLLDFLLGDVDEITTVTENLKKCQISEEPLHKRYLRFTKENNMENFHNILKELPKEWTIVQLTASYNPNDNFKTLVEYQTEVDSIYLSVFTNDYMDECGMTPFTVNLPANTTKEGLKPLFVELHSLLADNYNTLDKAQFLNSKKLVKNYWDSREEVDLRMKSVINVMDKQWLGGFSSLLTGRLVDQALKQRVKDAVDNAIADWGFIKLTNKQKIMFYNLMDSCSKMTTSAQIKSCIRKILTENGNIDDIRQTLDPCDSCTKEFKLVNELCLKCLSSCFERLHHFTLTDGIRAFSALVTQIKDGDEFVALKKAQRYPVILIVDEILDTFPWETLPVLSRHPVSRVENIHFLYYLYNTHKSDIVDGHYVTKGHDGRYVINPEKNLNRMEKRMSSFVQYWCKDWSGHVAEPPPPDTFIDYITNADIFLYCGHGDGCQLARAAGGGVERARRARAACVLAGCGSARLAPAAARAPPQASTRALQIAGCPTVIGMLWEVTDLEVDKVVSSLLSLCVPSDARAPWQAVAKDKWSDGEIADAEVSSSGCPREPELLRAMVRARASTSFVMIAGSVVARGLPLVIR